MKTILRDPYEVSTNTSSIRKATNYKNQMKFTGIKQDDNIYAIDQDSSRDAQNVYVDDNQRLSSRPPLQKVDLPTNILLGKSNNQNVTGSITPATYRLIDIKDFGSGKIYVSSSTLSTTPTYYIVAVLNETPTLNNNTTLVVDSVTNYHIALIEHYVICFNNVNAKILDTNNLSKGWQNFTDYAEVPVVKRITGSGITAYDKNQFIPNKYIEEYILSSSDMPVLPDGRPDKIELNSALGNFDLSSINYANKLTEHRILAPINTLLSRSTLSSNYIVSCGKNTVCLGASDHFYFSPNCGKTFQKVMYPNYNGEFFHIAEVSKDGNYFFFVCAEGVYRCELGSLTWSNVFRRNNSGTAADLLGRRGSYSWQSGQRCYFLNGDTFAFELYDNSNIYLYFKGNGLYMGSDYTADHMDSTASDYYLLDYITEVMQPEPTTLKSLQSQYSSYNMAQCLDFNMFITTDINGKTIAVLSVAYGQLSSNQTGCIVILVGGDNSVFTRNYNMFTYVQYLTNIDGNNHRMNFPVIYNVVYIPGTFSFQLNYEVEGSALELDTYYGYEYTFTFNVLRTNQTIITYTPSTLHKIASIYLANSCNTLIRLNDGTYISDGSTNCITVGTDSEVYNSVSVANKFLCYSGNIFYVSGSVNISQLTYDYDYKIWTNYWQDTDTFQVDYIIGSAGNYTAVPKVTYSDTELYLGFDNNLKITYNTKDPDDVTKTLFNLPAINNQSFIDNITAMINISTTEVALFFENKIVICSKVTDENLTQGFRYDYYNTKLSTGVRLGDSVINTLEGSYTIFPTLRGLAAMNYQAFMATTDQVVAYLSDVVKEIWTDFYMKSKEIHIIQWRSRLVITNDTEYCLIFDIEEKAWWKWKVPVKFNKAMSDQIFLQMIENSGTTDDTLRVFDPEAKIYYDYSGDKNREDWKMIEWYIMSQPLHFNQPNYYKNIKQLVFQLQSDAERQLADGSYTKEGVKHSIDAQVRLYRKKITTREPETINFTIDGLRTFVKRFNYWKINELKWVLSYDENTASPQRFELNGVSVKYEIGDEVR